MRSRFPGDRVSVDTSHLYESRFHRGLVPHFGTNDRYSASQLDSLTGGPESRLAC